MAYVKPAVSEGYKPVSGRTKTSSVVGFAPQ